MTIIHSTDETKVGSYDFGVTAVYKYFPSVSSNKATFKVDILSSCTDPLDAGNWQNGAY